MDVLWLVSTLILMLLNLRGAKPFKNYEELEELGVWPASFFNLGRNTSTRNGTESNSDLCFLPCGFINSETLAGAAGSRV